jgi:phospholipid/cholesterol/gamma-HCH transport system substrate-binding protein
MSSEAKVGLFVVVALSIFVATFLSVATIQMGGEKTPYTARFRFAGGLEAGKVVRFGGLKAGVITDVRRAGDDPTMAEVLLELRNDIPVNEDSVASISSLNALGDNYMEISPGTKEAARIPPGGLIQSEEAVTFSDITKKVVEVTDTAQTMMADVKGDVELLIADLRELTGNLTELTGQENQESIKGLLKGANEMVETQAPKIDQITDQIAVLLEKVDATVAEVRVVVETADKTVSNIDRTVEETREPIKRDLAEIEATLIEARKTIEEMRILVASNSSDIDATIQNFRRTSENLEQFSDEIKQRPWSLLRTKPKEDRRVPVPVN